MIFNMKEYMKEYNKQYYLANKERLRDISRRNYKRNKDFINKIKERGCQICGFRKYTDAICLHHKNPNEKEREIKDSLLQTSKKIKLIKEINKCILLCSNCHRHYHYLTGTSKKYKGKENLTDEEREFVNRVNLIKPLDL